MSSMTSEGNLETVDLECGSEESFDIVQDSDKPEDPSGASMEATEPRSSEEAPSKVEETPAKPSEMLIDHSHLFLVKNSTDYANTADVNITVRSHVFPCHSAILSLRSEVLRKILKGPKAGWDEKISEVFSETSPTAVKHLLSYFYFCDRAINVMEKDSTVFESMEAMILLATQLEAEEALEDLEDLMLNCFGADLLIHPRRWLKVAGIAGMGKLQESCLIEIVRQEIDGDESIIDFEYETLSSSDLSLILRRVLPLLRQKKAEQPGSAQAAPKSTGSIKIFAKRGGTTLTIEVDSSDDVSELKKKIEKKIGVPCSNQYLYYGCIELENSRTLHSYGIKSHFTISVMSRSSYPSIFTY